MEPIPSTDLDRVLAEAHAEAEAQNPEPTPTPKPTDALRAKPGEPIEHKLPDGRTVMLQKPKRSTLLHAAEVLGPRSTNGALEMYFTALMWVTHYQGLQLPGLNSYESFKGLMERLTDKGVMSVVIKVGELDSDDDTDFDAVKK